MRPRAHPVALSLLALLCAGSAQGYTLNGRQWDATSVRFHYNPAGAPVMGGGLNPERALDEALEVWSRVPCAAMQLERAGTTTATWERDGLNTVYWVSRDWPYSEGAAGATLWVPTAEGEPLEVDLALNGVDFSWVRGGGDARQSTVIDPVSVIAHELGHCLGLGHSADPFATMFRVVLPNGVQATLTADDKAGLCHLYPTGLDECGDALPCPDDHACREIEGLSLCDELHDPVGADCNKDHLDCADMCVVSFLDDCSTTCLYLSEDYSRGYCAALCGEGYDDCAPGFTCTAMSTRDISLCTRDLIASDGGAPTTDSGASPDAGDEDAAFAAPVDANGGGADAGCGCSSAARTLPAPGALAALVALALLGAARRRRGPEAQRRRGRNLLLAAAWTVASGCGPVEQAADNDAVHVDPAASAGGDGSAAHPFRSLSEALAELGQARVVVLAPGEHQLPLEQRLPAGIAVRGAGAGQTVLQADGEARWTCPGAATLTQLSVACDLSLGEGRWRFEGVAFSGASARLQVEDAAALELVSCDFSASLGLTARRVETVRLQQLSLYGGRGLWLEEVADAALEALALQQLEGPGLVLQGTACQATDVRLTSVAPLDDLAGDGLIARESDLSLRDAEIGLTSDRGVVIEAGSAELQDVAVYDTGRTSLYAALGARVITRACELARGHMGVYANDAAVELRDCSITSAASMGVLLFERGDLVAVGLEVRDSPDGLVVAQGEEISVRVEASTLTGASNSPCLSVTGALGEVTVTGSSVATCNGQGMSFSDLPQLEARANDVQDIQLDNFFHEIADGISASRTRGTIAANTVHDLLGTGVALDSSVVVVEDNLIGPTADAGMRVVGCDQEPTLIRRNTVQQAQGSGIAVLGSIVALRDNTIRQTAFSAAYAMGEGIFFGSGGDVTLEANVIEGNAYNGILYGDGAAGVVRDNQLRDNGRYGIAELCLPDIAPSAVVIRDNTYSGNGLGDSSSCDR